MTDPLAIAAGAACAFAGSLLPRSGAGARWQSPIRVLLDLALPALSFALVTTATARPLFAGILTFVLCAGYAHSDRSKRAVLAEPIVFTDIFQAFDIFRHPNLALPFPDKLPILSGVVSALILFGALFVFEPPVWAWTAWPLAVLLALIATSVMLLKGPLNARVGRWLRRMQPTADPFADAASFGPIGVLFVHSLLARSGRAEVRARAASHAAALPPLRAGAGAPLVLIQCESFFDARRLGPAVKPGLLPAFDRLSRNGLQWGRLAVPSWGANTVRTEFAVLSGLDQDAIGFDRFNPYYRLAREPIVSLASRLRDQGYLTICVHPFDRQFYGRDRVMPNLGFDEFLGEEAFPGAERVNGYIADSAVARVVCRLLEERGPRLFMFIVTMENHGPWNEVALQGEPQHVAAGLSLSATERQSLNCYLANLAHTDDMFQQVAEKLSSLDHPGTLALYGDHLPSFGSTFAKLALRDHRSDYLIWRPGLSAAARREDVAADELGEAVLRAHFGVETLAESVQHVGSIAIIHPAAATQGLFRAPFP